MSARAAPTLLFVYGTLKRGGSNHAHLAGQHFVAAARTRPGFALIDLGDYPGLIRAADDRLGVTGELWSVDAACLSALDELEGLAEGLYLRAPARLALPHEDVSAETYLYNRDATARPRLGDTWPV